MRRFTALVAHPRFVFWLNVGILVFLIPWTAALAIPSSPLFNLGRQVWYVTFISHIALILSAWSTAQAASVSIAQQREENRRLQADRELHKKLDDIAT